jgi:hypothetical protein
MSELPDLARTIVERTRPGKAEPVALAGLPGEDHPDADAGGGGRRE